MSDKDISTIYIDNSKSVEYSRYCDLCGESFRVDLYEVITICPNCKIAWRKIRDKVLFNEVHNER